MNVSRIGLKVIYSRKLNFTPKADFCENHVTEKLTFSSNAVAVVRVSQVVLQTKCGEEGMTAVVAQR